MLTFTAQGRIEVYLNGVLISRHVQEREAIESISRHQGIGTYEVVYPKVLVRKVERVSRETFVETGYGYGSGMAVEVVRRIVDTTAPSVGSLTAYGMTASQVSLTWSDTGASYYELYKSLDGTNWGFLTTTADTVYNDTGLSAGTFYYYRYRAVDQTGNKSSFSATVAPIFPAVPTSLAVTGVTGTTITLDWADNAHSVSNYKVYRSTNGTTYSLIASPTSSAYPDSGLTAGTTYYYKVSAVTAYGESAQSSAVSQTTTTAGPDWTQNLPSITFTRGVTGQTFDFYPTYLNTNNSVNITVESGTLPPEIRIVSSPTPRLAYDGTGTGSISAQVSFRVSTTAQADWQSRISGSGVVWYHNFESASEVNQFRWASAAGGNDPTSTAPDSSYVSYDSTDGVLGGCLKWRHPAGTYEPDAAWWRPFFPISGAQNGRGIDDPAANNTLTRRNWTPATNDNMLVNSPYGYYGNSIYHAAHPGQFDGTEYWLQFRVKVDLARAQTVISGGKFWYQTTNFQSLTAQEIVTYPDVRAVGGQIVLRVNRSGGTPADQDPPGDTINGQQVNSEYGYCDVVTSPGGCWAFTGGWDVLMYHVRPGTHSGNDTLLEIWAAPSTNPSVPVRIWNQTNMDLPFDTSTNRPKGINAFLTVPYGQANYNAEYGLKFCQMIFSTATIPWPTV